MLQRVGTCHRNYRKGGGGGSCSFWPQGCWGNVLSGRSKPFQTWSQRRQGIPRNNEKKECRRSVFRVE